MWLSNWFKGRWRLGTWIWAGLIGSVFAETLTLPPNERPEWLRRDGLVMAGSWEPLLFRVRRDGGAGYTPTAEQRAAYEREHRPEMLAQLKALGVNFIMMHAYKGFGLQAEAESMADAVRFARLCHEAGLHVGVYNYSGAFGWELFFQERPEAKEWVVVNQRGQPVIYADAPYRYFWNRNHPAAQAFYQNLVRFAIQEIQTDLIHFDNYEVGPGFDANSIQRFRAYLGKMFTASELKGMDIGDLALVRPPTTDTKNALLQRAWLDFSCQSLADSYHDMARYARGLRQDILVECNPGGPGERIRPPVDHGRLLLGGEAFWDEGLSPGFHQGRLQTRIRTFKVASALKNLAFAYIRTPLEAAEAMAFNPDCLGCIGWFEYGKITAMPGTDKPVANSLAPYIHFYHTRRELFQDKQPVADAAVLRSFPSQAFAEPKWALLTSQVEQTLIENRVPFQIVYDQQLNDLRLYRALILAGCVALSDPQIAILKQYAAAGGQLCVVGPVATHDEWFRPRSKPDLPDLQAEHLLQVPETNDYLAAIKRSCGGRFSLSVDAPLGLCAELTEQPGRRIVHLVNNRSNVPTTNVAVKVALPAGNTASKVWLTSPERSQEIILAFEQHPGAVSFTVPKVNVYEVAVVVLR